MSQLPHDLYSAAQVRELDRIAIEQFGIDGLTLMERAGAAAHAIIHWRWPQIKRVALLCGRGNNAGDAYVVARLLHQEQCEVKLLQLGEPPEGEGIAAQVRRQALDAGVASEPFNGQALDGYDLVVDGLLGTGTRGEVTGHWAEAIEAINRSGRPVLALDIPSGLDADSGRILGRAVSADATVSFIGLKQGMFTASGPQQSGEVHFASLAVPERVYETLTPVARRIDYTSLRSHIKRRPRDSHKGSNGHVLVIGGELGMSGAVRLAAEAAARSGAGLVSVATREAHAPLINLGRPELMCHGVESPQQLKPLLSKASVVAIGPGLGQGDWAHRILAYLLDCELPMVVDADALNLLADEPQWRRDWVLTPHPGEAARLLGQDSAQVQANRPLAAAEIAASYGGVCLLKGSGTVIQAEGETTAICSDGNPGMASGGMGDLLTGVIAALIAQGMPPVEAARYGAVIHAAAGDAAARIEGERGMLASDLLPQLRRLLNPA